MVANRFCWESASAESFKRIHCGIIIDGVMALQRQNLVLSERGRLLNLLTINAENAGLLLKFSAGVAIRVESPRWTVQLTDFGEPWPTPHQPQHPMDGASPNG